MANKRKRDQDDEDGNHLKPYKRQKYTDESEQSDCDAESQSRGSRRGAPTVPGNGEGKTTAKARESRETGVPLGECRKCKTPHQSEKRTMSRLLKSS